MNVKNTALALALVAAFAAPAFAADQTPLNPAATPEASAPAKAPEIKKEAVKKHHHKKKKAEGVAASEAAK